jgi:hypothetical protein
MEPSKQKPEKSDLQKILENQRIKKQARRVANYIEEDEHDVSEPSST